jgi:hypothetical protein
MNSEKNSRIEALIAAYQVKPKKLQKRAAKPVQRSPKPPQNASSSNLVPRLAAAISPAKKQFREHHSVQPRRSESNLALARYLNSSLDEDMEKLDSLTVKNVSIRSDWLSVKQRMIELSVKKKLVPILESEEITIEMPNFARKDFCDSFEVLQKYESRASLHLKDRIKSLDNLLLVD